MTTIEPPSRAPTSPIAFSTNSVIFVSSMSVFLSAHGGLPHVSEPLAAGHPCWTDSIGRRPAGGRQQPEVRDTKRRQVGQSRLHPDQGGRAPSQDDAELVHREERGSDNQRHGHRPLELPPRQGHRQQFTRRGPPWPGLVHLDLPRSGVVDQSRQGRSEIPPYRYGTLLDSELGGPAHQFRLRTDLELFVDVDEVTLHGALAHTELAGDRAGRLAAGGEQSHLAFASAQRIDPQAGPPPRTALSTGHEDLDLISDRVDVAEPRPVVSSGQLDVTGSGKVLREVPRVAHLDPRVTCPVQDQGWLLDLREQVADVHPHVHTDGVLRHGGSRRHPQVPRPPRAMLRIVGWTRAATIPPRAGRPRPVHSDDGVLELLSRGAVGVVGGPARRRAHDPYRT